MFAKVIGSHTTVNQNIELVTLKTPGAGFTVVVFLVKKILYVVTNQQVHAIAVSLFSKLEGKVKSRTQSTIPLLRELLLIQFIHGKCNAQVSSTNKMRPVLRRVKT